MSWPSTYDGETSRSPHENNDDNDNKQDESQDDSHKRALR